MENNSRRNSMKDLDVRKIVTIYERNLTDPYCFEGEKHNFWEFLYVDKGQIDVIAESDGFRLKQNEVIFHKPNEFHALMSVEGIPSSAIIISFVCHSKAIDFFRNQIIAVSQEDRQLIYNIVKEAKLVFKNGLGPLFLDKTRREEHNFASEQMMYGYLEMFLISVYRRKSTPIVSKCVSIVAKQRLEMEVTKAVTSYLDEHICEKLMFGDICKSLFISQTQLKVLFKQGMGKSVMQYFKEMKMERAKALINEGNMTFTEIALYLGFDTVHYFSSSFKAYTGMTPTNYYNMHNYT